jgi:hypothetical protein
MEEIIITDPKQRGTLEHNNELVIFMGLCETNQDIVLHDEYKLYINGELAVKDIAEKTFNIKRR